MAQEEIKVDLSAADIGDQAPTQVHTVKIFPEKDTI